MSTQTITFPNKNAGDLFTHTDVNMIKSTVNEHASVIDSLVDDLNDEKDDVDSLSLALQELEKNELVTTKQEQAVAGLTPGPLYLWPQPVTSLVLNKTPGPEGRQNEYKLQFTVSGNSFSLAGSLFQDVRWAGGEPDFEDGYTYQVSIVNGLAVAAGWENESE